MFVIGLNENQQSYVHTKIYLLSGRNEARKAEIGQKVLDCLFAYSALNHQQTSVQLAVELVEMPKQDYFKQVIQFKN